MNLNSPITDLPFVGKVYSDRLKKISVEKVEDLLLHIPRRFEDFRNTTKINDVRVGENVTVKATVEEMKNIYTKSGKVMQQAIISDETGSLIAAWFNQPYLVRSINQGDILALSGKVGFWGRRVALTSPEFEKLGTGSLIHTGRLVPIYPQTAGISSKWLRRQIKVAYDKSGDSIKDFLPQNILKQEKLISLKKAIKLAHYPKKMEDYEIARKRLAFNELLFLQLKSIKRKKKWERENKSKKISIKKEEKNKFIEKLPFKLTSSQQKSIDEILIDLKKDFPMNRLLEGDVGSGKTIVSAIPMFVAVKSNKKAVFMAPTQILAKQHFDTLNNLFSPYKISISLVAGGKKETDKKLSDIMVGTHALLHQKTRMKDVILVVIDEQQRFGVEQREHLAKPGKGRVTPHVLTTTATPIPRTVALTAYGDLELSTLDEMPKGRKRIKTWNVPRKKRKSGYLWIEKQIQSNKSQAFVVCPLIEESDKESMKQVKASKKVFEELKKFLPNMKISLLHGKLKSKEKEKIIEKFRKKQINILVSTPIVEVGIDIPNATIMVIEAADRFGLAQLHQLRGRVGRGKKKSYCLLFTDSKSEKVKTRLSAMQKGLTGFELSELDLKLRGPGEFFGTAQHGFPELSIASWADLVLIKKTKKLAEKVVNNPIKFKTILTKVGNESN